MQVEDQNRLIDFCKSVKVVLLFLDEFPINLFLFCIRLLLFYILEVDGSDINSSTDSLMGFGCFIFVLSPFCCIWDLGSILHLVICLIKTSLSHSL